MTSIEDIEPYLANNDWPSVVHLALQRWRRTKAPMDAEILERASAKRKSPPLPKRFGQGVFQDQWLLRAMAKKPIDLPALLDSFTTDLTTTITRPQFDRTSAGTRVRNAIAAADLGWNQKLDVSSEGIFMALAPRVEALAGFKADPRIARRMMQLITHAPFLVSSPVLRVAAYGPIFQLLAEMMDVRQIPLLERLLGKRTWEPYWERAIGFALRDLRAVTVEADDPEATLALATRLGFHASVAPPRVETELFDQVVANLADNDLRAVLADRWLEAGNSQGELVALQLREARGQTKPGDAEQIKTLLHYGEPDWLGDLAVVTRERIYDRGLLDACELSPTAAATTPRWLAAAKDPRLGTVRRLRRNTCSFYWAFVVSPALPNLEQVEVRHLEEITDLLGRPPRPKLAELVVMLDSLPPEHVASTVERLAGSGRFRSLTLETAGRGDELGHLLQATASTDISLRSSNGVVTRRFSG